jgi:nitrogen fixation NifU-like protein
MTREEIQKVYKECILPENRDPYHFQKYENGARVKAFNPMCGDHYMLYLTCSEKIDQLYFHGFGCALSKASSSLMIRSIEGMEKEEAIRFCNLFLKAVDQGDPHPALPHELKVLADLTNFEGRVDCIQLSWKALVNHLNH